MKTVETVSISGLALGFIDYVVTNKREVKSFPSPSNYNWKWGRLFWQCFEDHGVEFPCLEILAHPKWTQPEPVYIELVDVTWALERFGRFSGDHWTRDEKTFPMGPCLDEPKLYEALYQIAIKQKFFDR